MDKRKNSEPTRLRRLYNYMWCGEFYFEKRLIATLSSIVIFLICLLVIFPSRSTIERIRDANSAYEICIEDNVHEMCLLEAIEAYN